jgi:hypothetical protein
MGTRAVWWLLAALLALAAGGAYWWSQRGAGLDVPVVMPQPQPVPASAPVSEAPAIRHPIAAASAAADASPGGISEERLRADIVELGGRTGVLTFLQLDGFVNRFVATVDNLDRDQAPTKVWPVNPVPGRFAADASGKQHSVNADNSLRYAPFVQFVENIDTDKALALYVALYPLFQQAYEELGYPGRYFNDRLVAVIDHLLQTPVPDAPLRLTLTEIKGPIPSQRPWVHYEFADPALQQLSAGQKMLLRMGPVNERRMKAKLLDIRSRLAAGAGARRP